MVGKSNFFRLTRANFKRAFGFSFIASVILTVCFLIFDMWTDFTNGFAEKWQGLSVWYFYFFSVVTMGTYSSNMLPMLAALPFSASYCEEQTAGITPFIVSRTSKETYCVSKILTGVLAGGLTLSLGVLLHTFLLSTQMPLLDADALRQMQDLPYGSAIRSGTGIGYFLIGAYLAFLRGALSAAAAMTVSAYITNKYVTIVSPLILKFIAVRCYGILKVPNDARLDLLLRGRSSIGTDGGTLLAVSIVVVLLVLLCGFLFVRRVRREIAYGSFT
jgi:hypothetical protein